MPDATMVIAEYNPRWPATFQEEKDRILAVINLSCSLEHVGSTAVPGLGAKPIIDIMAGIRRLGDAGECMELLGSIGYEYRADCEAEIPEKRYFRKSAPPALACHLHMVEIGSGF